MWRDFKTGEVKDAWMIDVKVVGMDGLLRRVRKVAPLQNRRAAERLEHQIRERLLATDVEAEVEKPEAPLFKHFADRFLETYAKTNNKPSEVASKESILRVHLVPAFGELLLDLIRPAHVEAYKAAKLKAGLARKTINNHREVALSDLASQALRTHPRRGPLVFCSSDGSMLTRGATRAPLRRALARAELRAMGWHCMRHSFASALVMRGAPLKSVQELLGHSTIEMTMRYAHLSPDARRDAVKLLDVRGGAKLVWMTSRGIVLEISLDGSRSALRSAA